MRNPKIHILIGVTLVVIGFCFLVVGQELIMLFAPRPKRGAGIVIGLALMAGGGFWALRAAMLDRKRSALQSGDGVIASWRVSEVEVQAFRRIDAGRAALFGSLRNQLRWQSERGGEVIIGTNAIVAGGAIIPIATGFASGISLWTTGQLCDVGHLAGSPSCLEFYRYFRGRNSRRIETIRLPIAASAEGAARDVIHHFDGEIGDMARDYARGYFDLHYEAAQGDATDAGDAREERVTRGILGYGLVCFVFGVLLLIAPYVTRRPWPPDTASVTAMVGWGLIGLAIVMEVFGRLRRM